MAGPAEPMSEGMPGRAWIVLAVGGLGVSAVMTQLALLREILSALRGNELVLGIVLGNWLLLTGLGTWLGRPTHRLRDPVRLLLGAQLAIALLPLAQVALWRVLRDSLFIRGAEIGVLGTALSSFLLLLPYGLSSGFLLTLACTILGGMPHRSLERVGPGNAANGVTIDDSRLASGHSKGGGATNCGSPDAAPIPVPGVGSRAAGVVYAADAVGSVAGGLLFSFILLPFLDHFALLLVPAILNLLLAAAVARTSGRRSTVALSLVCATGLVALAVGIDMDAWTTTAQYRGQTVLFRANSPYGRLVVTRSAGQLNVFENSLPILATQNPERVEETVHYPMAQRPDAAKVLLVSGGASGTAREILKYPVKEVVYVELDPLILDVAHRFLPESLRDPRIRAVNADGRRFVEQTPERFDVVILDLPEPSTAQLNRFFTVEFFAGVQRVLAPDGVISFGLGRYENYVSPELARVLGAAHRTLEAAFAKTLVLPGGRVFFLGSNGPLFPDIAARLDQRQVPRQLVTRHYLEAMLAPDRMADMQRAVSEPAPVNRDFNPVLYYEHLRHWLSQFGIRLGPLQVALVGVCAVCFLRPGNVSRAMFASGFGGSALQMVLLLAHQTLFGSLYRQVALIVTIFMAGLAVGALLANRFRGAPSRQSLARLAFALAAFSVILPGVLLSLRRILPPGAGLWGEWIAIPGLTLVLATLVGIGFPVANRLMTSPAAVAASRLYTADFVGAALGAFLVSTWLMPALGVAGVCWVTAGLNAWAGAALWLGKDFR